MRMELVYAPTPVFSNKLKVMGKPTLCRLMLGNILLSLLLGEHLSQTT